MARKLSRDSRKKIRNPQRRIRFLDLWAASFMHDYPHLDQNERYWNVKIPVEANLVQGKYSTNTLKAQCAQRLINACAHLINSQPEELSQVRTTAVICLPDMFCSE